MTAIPFPLSTSPGERPQEGAGRIINAFSIPRGEGAGAVWHRAPGLIILGSENSGSWVAWSFPFEEWFVVREQPTGQGTFRGGVVANSVVYGSFGTGLYQVDSSGSFTTITGTLAGTSRVFWARDNASPTDIVFVADGVAYYIDSGGAKAAYPDGDVSSPTCVCFHDGYFMFGYGDGKIRATAINGTSINTLDVTTAESNPDGINRLWSYNGLLYAAGPQTIEVYGTPVNAVAFPLTRQGYHITPGLITANAVAGFEAEFGQPPIYVGSDNTVRWLQGFTPSKISPPELDALISAVEDKDTLEALCYISKGHPMWQLSCDDWTWVFNLNNGKWHERNSYLSARSRMTNSIFAFDKWLVGDTDSGNMLQVDGTSPTETDSPIVVRFESGAVKDFPNRVRVSRADFDFTVGVGDATGSDPIETDPVVLISWSDDGGYSWSNPWTRKLGPQAETQQRITVLNTGQSGPMGRKWRLDISDPVHVGLLGGDMSAEARIK